MSITSAKRSRTHSAKAWIGGGVVVVPGGGATKPKLVSMSSIVQDVGRGVSGMASQNGVQLDCEIAEEELTVLGDPKQLTRALQNVIVNAIQAATEKRGKVVVNCREKDLYAD